MNVATQHNPNPLAVLANAASQYDVKISPDDSGVSSGEGSESEVMENEQPKADLQASIDDVICPLSESEPEALYNTALLRVSQSTSTDHSYSNIFLPNGHSADDEGYSSRASLDGESPYEFLDTPSQMIVIQEHGATNSAASYLSNTEPPISSSSSTTESCPTSPLSLCDESDNITLTSESFPNEVLDNPRIQPSGSDSLPANILKDGEQLCIPSALSEITTVSKNSSKTALTEADFAIKKNALGNKASSCDNVADPLLCSEVKVNLLNSNESEGGSIRLQISAGSVRQGTSVGPPTTGQSTMAQIGNIGSLSLPTLNSVTNKVPMRPSCMCQQQGKLCQANCLSNLNVANTRKPASINKPIRQTSRQTLDESDLSSLELHPIIDHDYCHFKHFNGIIQSGIILSIELNSRHDRRHQKRIASMLAVKRTKSERLSASTMKNNQLRAKAQSAKARSKSLVKRHQNDRTSLKCLANSHDLPVKNKRGRPRKIFSDFRVQEDQKMIPTTEPANTDKVFENFKPLKDGESYIKIPGLYQNEFVYYATSRKRRCRRLENPSVDIEPVASAKTAAVGGLNLFDWYSKNSKTDKGLRFGFSTETKTLQDNEVADLVYEMETSQCISEKCVDGNKIGGVAAINDDFNNVEDVSSLNNLLNSMDKSQLDLLDSLGSDLEVMNDSDLLDASDISHVLNRASQDISSNPTLKLEPLSKNSETDVPELTTVSMFWNDLPGLVIDQTQYVRLVDIHKQVLPAKDTGILKKRCQMMNLSLSYCSEMQRNFLIRYCNAAKSKSMVIVDKQTAQNLIGYYVNRNPKLSTSNCAGTPIISREKKIETVKPHFCHEKNPVHLGISRGSLERDAPHNGMIIGKDCLLVKKSKRIADKKFKSGLKAVNEKKVAEIGKFDDNDEITLKGHQILTIGHRDIGSSRLRSKPQLGNLYLSKYIGRDAHCVQCLTCNEWLSIRTFMKHQHIKNNPDELIHVLRAQKLELVMPNAVPDDERLWHTFQAQQIRFNQTKSQTRCNSSSHLMVSNSSSKSNPSDVMLRHESLEASKINQTKVLSQAPCVGYQKFSKGYTPVQEPFPLIRCTHGTSVGETKKNKLCLNEDISRQSGRVRRRKQLHACEKYI